MIETAQTAQNEAAVGRASQKWLPTVLYSLFAVLTVGVIWFATFKPILVLPRIRLSPGYAFVDQQGELVTSEDYRGRFTLYTFSYAGCAADGCPVSTAELAEVHQFLNGIVPEEMDLHMVTISLDAEADMAEAWAGQPAALETTGRVSWQFLAGEPLRTKYTVGSGFGVYFEQEAERIRFIPRYVLVDPNGIIRAEYRAAVPDLEILERDIGLLAQEMQNSEGIGRIGYEAAHLFVCYP